MRALHRKDSETNLQTAFARALADDLKPVDENGNGVPARCLYWDALFCWHSPESLSTSVLEAIDESTL